MIPLNLNDDQLFVKVKLKEDGIHLLKKRREEFNQYMEADGAFGLGEYEVKTDQQGYTTFQLGEFLNKFGHVFQRSNRNFFEEEIILFRD